MTDTQMTSLIGGFVGGALVGVVVFIIAFYALTVIATWKIFTKAGEKGWKALIPIYNVYVLCKVIGVNFWIWILAVPCALGFITGFIGNEDASNTLQSLYMIGLEVYLAIKLGKAFNKSTGFIVGLILLPNIFELILGFGSSEYVGIK